MVWFRILEKEPKSYLHDTTVVCSDHGDGFALVHDDAERRWQNAVVCDVGVGLQRVPVSDANVCWGTTETFIWCHFGQFFSLKIEQKELVGQIYIECHWQHRDHNIPNLDLIFFLLIGTFQERMNFQDFFFL